MSYYVYLWLRTDGTPYYVGKGSGNRAFRKHRLTFTPPPRDQILVFLCETEAEAFAQEVNFIDLYGRKDQGTGCLRNLTDGGENPPTWEGKKHPPEFGVQISARQMGRVQSKETRAKISATRKDRIAAGVIDTGVGAKRSASAKQKMKAAAYPRVGEKNPFFGRRHTEETKRKIGAANQEKARLRALSPVSATK
jgi:hypothetical protein